MKAFLKKYQFHIAYFALMAAIAVFCAFNYQLFIRIWLSLKHFGINIYYYFVTIYDRSASAPSQVFDTLLLQAGDFKSLLPLSFIAFKDRFIAFLAMLVTLQNIGSVFTLFMTNFVKLLYFVNIIAIFIPVFVLFNYLYFLPTTFSLAKVNHDTMLLKSYRKLSALIRPLIDWLVNLWTFIRSKWFFRWPFYIMFALMINLLPVTIDVVSWYFYFVASFDWTSLYKLVVIILVDLYEFLTFFPWWAYALAAYLIFDKIRQERGYKLLEHYENYDKGFIKSTGIVVLFDGVPGAGKTELMTDFDLSCDQMFREDVFSIMREVDNLYPHFPFRLLEIDVENLIRDKKFVNRAQLRKIFYEKFNKVDFNDTKPIFRNDFYNYDFVTYGQWSYLGLKLEHITESLIDYAQAYFLYIMSCSFLMGNFSIRTDAVQLDYGHLKVWNYDFFRSGLERISNSRISKRLPIDSLRFGRQFIKDNPNTFVLDNCIITFTEVDKELGNQFDIKKSDPKSPFVNMSNQKFNVSLKLGRHPSTLRFRTLFKFTGDLQRFGSVNSDFHELASTQIHVSSKNEFNLALPLYLIEPALCEWLLARLEALYIKFRVARSDNTFLINLVRVFKSLIYKYYTRRLNTFGFWPLSLLVTDGSMRDETNRPQKYFLMKKKIHSDRYATDAYSEFFTEKYLQAKVGFAGLDEFADIKASPDELRSLGSIFIRALERRGIDDDVSDDESFVSVEDDGEVAVVDNNSLPGETAITL